MRAQLLHLSGPRRGSTVTYAVTSVVIGTADDCNARLFSTEVAPHHARIDFVQDECQFHLRALGGKVFVNGSEVEEVILQDGDQLEFGVGGPRVRFRIYVPIGAVCKPVRRMLADARDVSRVSGRVAGTRSLTRDLLTQATPRLKVGVPLALVLFALAGGALAGWLTSRQDEGARQRTSAELEELHKQTASQSEAIAKMERSAELLRRIQRQWTGGVCLMHGIFRLRMPDQSFFRVGREPFEIEYTGSGFLVSTAGHVVTNRHVVAPWLEMERVTPLLEGGAVPVFTHLSATFPGRAPIDVPTDSILRRQDDLDVAVVQLPVASVEGIPVLPLHIGTIEGEDQRAIVVGYPTGLNALMARADSSIVDDLRARQASMTEAIAELAAHGQVTPLITQGVVSNVQDRIIVYDATTTHGGSGGPVFGGSGDVIAVNFAILSDFTGANFGVPIRFARELLPH